MKIKKFTLKGYGPIKEFYLKPDNFNVIFGLNESGKTTLVEALTSVLFKTKTRYGKPEDISIELDTGKKRIILPSTKQVSILPRAEIAPLLYIPASASELYKKSDSQIKFWDSLKLILSQTGKQIPFATLIKKLREEIGYQPKLNDWKSEKKKLIEDEKNRLEQLRNFIQEIDQVEKKKKELKRLTEEHAVLTDELNLIETCKRYKLYQNLKKLYNEYIDKKNSFDLYQRYTEDDLKKWQELEIRKENLKNQLAEKSEIEKEIINFNRDFTEVSKKLEMLEKYNIKNRISQQSKIEKEPNYFFPILIFLIGFLFLILSFRFNLSILIPLMIFLVSAISFTTVAVKKSKIRIKKLRLELVLNDAKLFLSEAQTIADLEKNIKLLEDNRIRMEILISTKQERLNFLSSIGSIEKIEQEIEELRSRTGCGVIDQLKTKIEDKLRLQNEIRGLGVEIFKYLDEPNDSKWARLIAEKEASPPAKECDINREEKIAEQIKGLKIRIDELLREIKIFEEVQKHRYRVIDEKNILFEIFELENHLKNYHLELQAVQKAEEILNQMSNELDNFIEDLVYGKESLSEYFYFITEKYKKVKVENRNFIAIDTDGNEYSVELLSTGAKDQLLFCFRLSALKKLFPEGTFLILDDAFIFADWHRRCKLAELLKKFINAGNQVLYFTSDTHSRDLLAQYDGVITTLE